MVTFNDVSFIEYSGQDLDLLTIALKTDSNKPMHREFWRAEWKWGHPLKGGSLQKDSGQARKNTCPGKLAYNLSFQFEH